MTEETRLHPLEVKVRLEELGDLNVDTRTVNEAEDPMLVATESDEKAEYALWVADNVLVVSTPRGCSIDGKRVLKVVEAFDPDEWFFHTTDIEFV